MNLLIIISWQLLSIVPFSVSVRTSDSNLLEQAGPIEFEYSKSEKMTSVDFNTAKTGKSLTLTESFGDLEEIFRIYNLHWLSQLWPSLKNGVHINVNTACWNDFTVFTKDFFQGRAWSLNALDASGKYSAGSLWGNRFWTGSRDMCRNLDNMNMDISNRTNELRHEEYLSTIERQQHSLGTQQAWRTLINQDDLFKKIVEADNTPPFRLAFSSVNVQLNVTKTTLFNTYNIIIGLCLPHSCTESDIHDILDLGIITNDNLRTGNTLPRTVKIIRVRTLYGNFSLLDETAFYILVTFGIFLMTLTVLGTLIDYNLVNLLSHNTGSMSLNSERPIIQKILASSTMDRLCLNDMPNDRINRKHNISNPIQISNSDNCNLKSPHDSADLNLVLSRQYSESERNINMNGIESLTINNMDNRSNINLVRVKKVIKTDDSPATITLDVVAMNKDNCGRCGRFKTKCQGDRCQSDKCQGDRCHGDRCQGDGCQRKKVAGEQTNNNYESINVSLANGKGFEMLDDNSVRSVLLAFSLRQNSRNLLGLSLKCGDCDVVHGIKVISICWIVWIHTCLIIGYTSGNEGHTGRSDSFAYNVLHIGTYAFDTFFFTCGLISARMYFKLVTKYNGNDIFLTGYFGRMAQLSYLLAHKLLRFLPIYLVAISVTLLTSKYEYSNNVLELPGRDRTSCDRYWWRNVLYINTFYQARDRCMHWSWCWSHAAQLVAFAALVAGAGGRLAAIGSCAITVSALGASAVAAYRSDILLSGIHDLFVVYEEVYNQPWARISPFFVGLGTGWFLYKIDNDLTMNKITRYILWILSLVIVTCTIFGVTPNVSWSHGRAALTALSHAIWSLAIAWCVMDSISRRDGFVYRILTLKYLYPLSRLSSSVFLLHPTLIRSIVLASNDTSRSSSGFLIIYFIGFLALSFMAGFCLSLFIEMPVIVLLKMVSLPRFRN